MSKEYSKSFCTAAKSMSAAMRILKANGDGMPSRQLMDKVEETVHFSNWEKEITSKGGIRWQNVYHFTSVDYVKAGYIIKKNGSWYLTPEGEDVLQKHTAEEIQVIANAAYRKWRQENETTPIQSEEEEEIVKENIINLEELEDKALTGIREYISKKNPYEFQDMVAALLRAMDYYTPFVAPKGKDGGVDITAYVDPLGAKTPRIKVQVKHYNESNAIAAKDIRSLVGILRDGDIGLFVTSGYFSPDAKREALTSKEYVKLIDGDEFITLWQQYYNKMSDEDKNMLPLRRIAFLGSND